MAFDARLLIALTANYTSPLDLQTGSAPLNLTKQFALSGGAGVNAADRIWADTRTITASGTDDMDLAGVLLDPFGVAITLARVKGIFVFAYATNTNNVVMGGGTNPLINWLTGTTPAIVVKPGGVLVAYAPDAGGYAVTASTGDILRATNSAGGSSVTYDIVIIGASS